MPTLFALALFVAMAFFVTACTPESAYEDNAEESVQYEEPVEVEPPPAPAEEIPEPEEEIIVADSWSVEEQIEAFDDFLEENFIDFVTFCIITLNSYIRNPEPYGITDIPVTWEGYVTTGISEESIADSWEWIETFRSFDREVLTPLQQQSYDILEWQVDSALISLETPMYYYRSSLQGSSGLHILLPILLTEFYFYNQQDIENYLQLLSEIHVVFEDAILLEQIRIERGLAITDRILNEMIEEVEGFIANLDYNTLLTSFDYRMDYVDFLTEEEIEDYTRENYYLFLNSVVPAYESLIQDLEGLRGNNQEHLGLAHFENGREFYRLRYRGIGSAIPPAQWFDIFDQRFREVSDQYMFLLTWHPEVHDYFDAGIHDLETPGELVAFQFEQSLDSFPPLPQGVTYSINRIDESLGGFAAGFYMIPQLDNHLVNVIYYNPDHAYNNEFMYSLLAHEALGHMLHFTTVFYSDLPYFRKINTLGFTGNIEGWAMHAQLYAYNFLNLSDINLERLLLWDEFSVLYSAIIDIGVHYMGWTLEETLDYLNSIPLLEFIPDESIAHSFYSTIRNPTRAIPYALGLIEVRDLQESFESALGYDFDMRTFNEVFLSKGPAPFPLVREWMEETFDVTTTELSGRTRQRRL
jgi:uncharacterized protein (DUF885 family)